MADVKLLVLYSNTWNHLTVCKKNFTQSARAVEYTNFISAEGLDPHPSASVLIWH